MINQILITTPFQSEGEHGTLDNVPLLMRLREVMRQWILCPPPLQELSEIWDAVSPPLQE